MFWAWTAGTVYMVVLGLVFLWRFQGGLWKEIRVIEPDLDNDRPLGDFPLPLVPQPGMAARREAHPFGTAEELPA
jgi:hypothetical protein